MKSGLNRTATFDACTSGKRKHFLNQKYEHEDVLDYMHRLAKMGLNASTISWRADMPVESVEWWMERNGYA